MWFPHSPQSPMSVFGSRSTTGGIPMPLAVALPAHPGGPTMAGSNPTLFASPGAGMPMMPPQIGGMPSMPGMPGWAMGGQMPPVDSFQFAQPVTPFDPSNQVQQFQQPAPR